MKNAYTQLHRKLECENQRLKSMLEGSGSTRKAKENWRFKNII